jgi:hypothetical protein
MTDTNAPERIWVNPPNDKFPEDDVYTTEPGGLDHEYVRAYLFTALEAQIARIEGRLTERRKMHRTDVLLARTADVRAQIAGVRPADAMAVSNLEEAYTDCVTRLDDATAQIAALEAQLADGSFYKESDIDAMQAQIAALDAERDRWKEAYRAVSNYLNLVVSDLDKAKAQVATLTKERDAARAVAYADAAEIVARISERDGGYAQAAFYEAEQAILARAAEVNAEPAMTGVRVKPLEWKETLNNKMYLADHGAGGYIVIHDFDGWRWLRVNGREMTGAQDHPVPKKEDAFAAAQADYTARILAALEKPE